MTPLVSSNSFPHGTLSQPAEPPTNDKPFPNSSAVLSIRFLNTRYECSPPSASPVCTDPPSNFFWRALQKLHYPPSRFDVGLQALGNIFLNLLPSKLFLSVRAFRAPRTERALMAYSYDRYRCLWCVRLLRSSLRHKGSVTHLFAPPPPYFFWRWFWRSACLSRPFLTLPPY